MSGEYLSPVLFPGAYISSGIGTRTSPGGIGSTNHQGIDIAAPGGTPVYAPTDLTVTRAGWSDSYGNVVYGVDSQGQEYRFAHMSAIDVANGATIAQGTELGQVGMTGHATGNHLHFEIRDKAGNLLKGLTGDVAKAGLKGGIDTVKKYVNQIADVAAMSNPIAAAAKQALDVLGLNPLGGGESCGVVCQLQKWIKETDFVKRVVFVVLGMILIVGSIVFFAKGEGSRIIKDSLT